MFKTIQIYTTTPIQDQLDELLLKDQTVHLKIGHLLKGDDLSLLKEFIKTQKPCPFIKLSLQVDLNRLKNKAFTDLIKQLNDTQLSDLELIIPENEVQTSSKDIIDTLNIATHASFPIHILESGPSGTTSTKMPLKDFENKIIAAIQKRNKEELNPSAGTKSRKQSGEGKRIRLKALINREVKSKNLSQYLPLEIQHVEQIEHQVTAEQVAVVEMKENLDTQEIQEFAGPLLGFQEFSSPLYKQKVTELTGDEKKTHHLYATLQYELFANIPQAIKYLSPDAATQLAANLPQFLTLNKDNLPNGFLLKQTAQGELVLDYDEFLENEKSNYFTPVEHEIEHQPIYNIVLDENKVRQWVNNKDLFTILCPKQPYTTPAPLMNLWIKYGDEGVEEFFEQFNENLKGAPARFILANYLMHLPQWDHLHDNQPFLLTLRKIGQYDKNKLECLENFLLHTGSSCHDLVKTVAGFEVFWTDVQRLCSEQKVASIEPLIKAKWTTPEGGNPIVYMERMLTLLKNARNVDDQFQSLDGIFLDNYGAYYASKYEGFKSVSKEMQLHYDAEKLNAKPFNKHLRCYQVGLSELVEPFLFFKQYEEMCKFAHIYERYHKKNPEDKEGFWVVDTSKELPQPLNLKQLQTAGWVQIFSEERFVSPYQLYESDKDGNMKLLFDTVPNTLTLKEFYPLMLRFLGRQESGVTVSSLNQQLNLYKKSFIGDYGNLKLPEIVFPSLFFISHEGYDESTPLKNLWDLLDRSSNHVEVMNKSINLLNQLYQRDIKLNQKDGVLIFSSIGGMNSFEFEEMGISKKECIDKLLTSLLENKFATLKLFNFRANKSNPKWPFLYALDTAEYLSSDTAIAAAYHNDLILFGGLINKTSDEAYFHALLTDPKNKDTEQTKIIQKNMEKVKHYFHLAATQERPNNLQYAIEVLLSAWESFYFRDFIKACDAIAALPSFDALQVNAILRQNQLKVGGILPEIFTHESSDLKGIMIKLIKQLNSVQLETQGEQSESKTQTTEDLAALSIPELQTMLQKSWEENGALLSVAGKVFMNKVLCSTRDITIYSAFAISASDVSKTIANKINALSDFQECPDFAKVNLIANEAQKMAGLVKQMLKNPFVQEQESDFIRLFEMVNFAKMDYETLYGIMTLLTAMPQRNYLALATTLFTHSKLQGQKETTLELTDYLINLNNNCFPSHYLEAFSQLYLVTPKDQIPGILNQMIDIFVKTNEDPILKFIMSNANLSFNEVSSILTLSTEMEFNRHNIANLLTDLKRNQTLEACLKQWNTVPNTKQNTLLTILSLGENLNRKKETQAAVNYQELTTFLLNLADEDLKQLDYFYQTTPVSSQCLINAFKNPNKSTNFQDFLLKFEKAPFGERDLKAQFTVTEVERVINQAQDLLNDTIYPYQHRKQLMEAFLFVNAIGENLPVYYNKPARELTNQELQSYFADLKAKRIKGLTPFQSRLMALGIMREAMYRSTGEFPYSTQMISLIDGLLHEGDFISNIDTGQGKSQTDVMKADLLWLDSDRVDLTTSSLVDSYRDIANYGSFLKLLNVPYSQRPITSLSPVEDFQKQGINFSTFAHLSLFFAKAKVTGEVLEAPDAIVSNVMNESDYTILDNRIIYRFATADNEGIGFGQEWIYYAINEFVSRPDFVTYENTSAKDDIQDLKAYLRNKAKTLKKSSKIIDKFSDDQYLTLLDSALMVNYVLEENVDYVIPEEFEKKVINGKDVRTLAVKVLLKDQKVSQDSTFGNGIQQLLYAHLNQKRGGENFVIEPQNKTIISSNNKNLIDYYRAHKGFIWGSSGTVGSQLELLEQYRKYGFEFAKAQPHQKKRVEFKDPILLEDELAQFGKLVELLLSAENAEKNKAPHLIFCKDINTAKRLYKEFEKNNSKKLPIQLYTGLGKEEEVIQRAAQPGMITITTAALGRNTDISYDKEEGLNVWHTSIASTREREQKAGRTGRQGSKGSNHFVLNAQELAGKTLEQIQQDIDRTAALEREVSEELYNILGYLLSEVDHVPDSQFAKGKSVFLREAWSSFSQKTEAQFRESRQDANYNNEVFMEKTLASFNEILSSVVSVPVIAHTLDDLKKATAGKHWTKAKYTPYTKEVKLEDCVPPVDIAYHILNLSVEGEESEQIKEEVKVQLKQLFTDMTSKNLLAKNKDYLHYLFAQPKTQKVIVEAHKEFVTEFLKENSKKLNFIQRWLGFESKLSKIVSNPNYLMTFHAFASIPNQPKLDFVVVQQAVSTLLDEYLENSWFINAERKQWATDLKARVNSNVTNMGDLIECLTKAQIETAKLDITTNRNRLLKSLHVLGQSRYQTTLNKALNLAHALSGKTDVDTKGLEELAAEVTDNKPLENLTLDEIKNKANAKTQDRGNRSVIMESLENAATIKNRKGPEGMRGRNTFFASSNKEKGAEKEEAPRSTPSKNK